MPKKGWIVLLCIVALGAWWFVRHRQAASAQATGAPAGSPRSGGAGGSGGRGGGGPGGGQGLVPVVAGEVKQQDVPIYLDGLGTVQAFNTVTVRARVDGELQKVVFTEGQEVKAGQLLAVVDPRPYQAQVDQAEAKKKQDEAQLANARLVLGRNEDLLRKKVIDQQTYDTSKYAADQLEATVQADQAALDNARTQLDYTQIKSPIDGRVGVRLVDQGNIIHANDTNGLVVITQLRPITVVFTLPEQSLQSILQQGGDPRAMRVSAMDRANKTALGEGQLAVVDNQIDQTTGTIRLKATFPNDELKLWPGQFVNARLLLTTRKDGLVIPASVVQRGPQGTYAYVIKPDKSVEMRSIKVAQTEGNEALIDDGLQAGEQVVVDGQYKLQPGARVELTGGPKPPQQSQDGKTPGARQRQSRGDQGEKPAKS